ncbi:MAG: isoprenylcysteine carboxylmethyltransferase family protein [Myxococcota bacterium]|nr:isoprenylcysteine carboxylmethyltransferase family protein [Myxococcota bacterium]
MYALGWTLISVVVMVTVSWRLFQFSRESPRDPHTHGFWRFFAFELILVLALIAAPRWFDAPLSVRQLLSWLMLCPAACLAFAGYWTLRTRGAPTETFEDTTVLIRSGIFGLIRHPMYAALQLLTWGLFLKAPGLLTGGLAGVSSALLVAAMRTEEREMFARFGKDYLDYCGEVRALVPFVL